VAEETLLELNLLRFDFSGLAFQFWNEIASLLVSTKFQMRFPWDQFWRLLTPSKKVCRASGGVFAATRHG
jgi:hypothetical protein